jgi:hypothetical protein
MVGPVDLQRFDYPLEHIILPGGREVAVRPVDGVVQRAIVRLGEIQKRLGEAQVELDLAKTEGRQPDLAKVQIEPALMSQLTGTELWDIAGRCLVGATEEEINGLTAVQCGIVLKIAQGRLKGLLEELEEHERGKVEARPPEPGQSPGISSPTRASESPAPPADPSGTS